MREIPDMGYLAESACNLLAAAIISGEPDGKRVRDALREFMWEAKKTPEGAGLP